MTTIKVGDNVRRVGSAGGPEGVVLDVYRLHDFHLVATCQWRGAKDDSRWISIHRVYELERVS